MEPKLNFLYAALAALIPLIIGFIWYSKPLFADAWMKAAGVTEEKIKNSNMVLILVLTLVFSFLLTMALMPIVIHQFGIFGVLANEKGLGDPNSEVSKYLADFMNRYGTNFRTFRHGAFHGTMSAVFFVLPIVAINALFERRNFKYIAIHTGYWIITLALMGGVICAFV
jgi:hypothetical protein